MITSHEGSLPVLSSRLSAILTASPQLAESVRGCIHQTLRYLLAGDLSNARDWLERALDIAPDHPDLMETMRELDGRLDGSDSSRCTQDGVPPIDTQRRSSSFNSAQLPSVSYPENESAICEPAKPSPATSSNETTTEIDRELRDVHANWNEFGKRDPLWAILTADSKRDGKWDLAEFFATGEREINGVVSNFESLNHSFGREKALDFGCGVGRLTQALGRHFQECHGIDIAESMVEQARAYNRFGDRCHYHVNTKPDLSLFANDTFDFVYTNIVLQHNPPAMSRRFIQEFLRILKPGGLLEFQLPSEPIQFTSGEGRAMRPEAFKAQLSVSGAETPWLAGAAKTIYITVKNISAVTWPGKAVSGRQAVRLGNHWRDAKDRVIINDDARADLPHDLKPGEEITLPLSVSIPGATGQYRLELDMVQEAVAWFVDKRSQTLLLNVDVAPNPQSKTPAKPDSMKELDGFFESKLAAKPASEPAHARSTVLVPRMEMNGIPKAEMLAFLAVNGAKILRVTDDTGATGWLGFRYQATKGASFGNQSTPIPTSPAQAKRVASSAQAPTRRTPDGPHQSAEDLLLSLRGRIAIVGNATPTQNFGEIIDAYDVVIRLNNFRVAGFEKLVGTKTSCRCTSGWSDIEHRNEHVEFSPFTAASAESANLAAFSRANGRPVLPAGFDVHALISETPKPSTGLALIQLCSCLEIPVDLFAFDGFKSAHYWEKTGSFFTTHSRGEMDFILNRPGVLLFGETYPYEALYDFCHQQHHDYDENVGLELVRRLDKQFHGLNILEFGAGNGQLARHLEQQSNQVTVVEASRTAFERIPCARKIHGTVLSLPFIKESFDTFMSVDVLEHLTENDCRIAIREAARLCKNVFVSVCTRPSGLLGPNGENLHLTVRPASWWTNEFGRYFNVETYAGYGNGQLVIEGPRIQTTVVLNGEQAEIQSANLGTNDAGQDDFYVNLFIKNPVWSTPHPNEDEAARWEKISGFVKAIKSQQPADLRLRILDVGCGRGWLTNLAGAFGDSEGVEPVAAVVEQARKLFPAHRFTVGTADTILASPDFQPYDLVLTSEVIEHVPRSEQPAFVRKLSRLLKPGGAVIVTTPRGEALQEWTCLAGDPSQPVEDWICEPELRDLFLKEQFIESACERVLFETSTHRYVLGTFTQSTGNLLPIYQVWAFLKPNPVIAQNDVGKPRSSAETVRPPGYSFCIITNGKRPQKLQEEIASIRALQIPNYEILVAGEVPAGLENVTTISLPDAAQNGHLGEMRNRLVERARYDHLVVADDDLLFQPDFYQGLRQYGEDYEVLCVRFLNADGTRYWDWATVGGPRGHQLLEYDETDPNVYVTGGLCIMKASVGTRVQWDEKRGFYQSEDVDFSRRLHAAGVSIKFNRLSTVVHADARYTEVGGVVMTAETLRPTVLGKVSEGKLDEARALHARLRALDPAIAAEVEKEAAPVLNDKEKLHVVTLPVRWRGPIFNPSGYASEAINFLLPLAERLDELGLYHHNNTYSEKFVAGLSPIERGQLFALRDKYDEIKGGIVIEHNPANGFTIVPDAAYHVGRTMFETDRISPDWVAACNQMDEIWVPSRFNVETFAASGVERDKLFVVPEAVDEQAFDPARHTSLPLANRAAFNFLSIFEWSSRKGWDVLLSAYLREFSAGDDVCLYLRTYLFSRPDGDPSEAIWKLILGHAATLGLGGKKLPRIELIANQVPLADLPRLYLAADCLVAPSRGEGWGRPHHEAMMMGLPVIATNWSGNTEFMNDENSYLIDYELADINEVELELWHYRGHRWASASESHLRALMRRVQQNPVEAREKGSRARAHMLKHFSRIPVADQVVRRLQAIERKLTVPSCPATATRITNFVSEAPNQKPPTIQVAWEGTFLDLGSLSHVNREITGELVNLPGMKLARVGKNVLPANLAPWPGMQETARRLVALPSKQAQATVRHSWPPSWERPASGAWVLVQPWEFGALPVEWVRQLARVDEIWAPSEYVRRVYVESGVAPQKVKVVPNGIDPARFHPKISPIKLATNKSFKFLFVGGTIHRKGPDLLLKAFLESFTAADDVCLVIKDFGGQSVYAGQTFEAQIKAAQSQPNAPEILYLNEELPPDSLPGLYTACDCLVHPYRGEGFGLPVLEAMACGLPVVVTGGGATDDFATDEFAYRLPALRKEFCDSISGMKLVKPGWLLEPDASALSERLKWIVAHRAEALAKGTAASDYVRREWTWARAARIAAQHLQRLVTPRETASATVPRLASKALTLPPVARFGNLAGERELLSQGQVLAAWNETISALSVRPYHPEAFLLLAEIARAAGHHPRAKELAEHARKLAPKWEPARLFLKSPAGKNATKAGLPPLADSFLTPRASRLTVCLITKNEERFLGQCLESIRDMASQIVVMDTGSTDHTVEIARQYGAEVYSFAWSDDFSAARNAALERAAGDWILVLDADEELLPDQHEKLRKLMQDPSAMAFRLPMIDEGREEEGVSYLPRLFRNAPGLFFTGCIHEHVFLSVEARRQEWGLGNKLGDATLLHHGYTAEVVERRGKSARNLKLLQKALRESPDDPNLLMNLGLELARAGRLPDGIEQYDAAFRALSALPAAEVVPEFCETLLTQFCTHLVTAKDYARVARVVRSPLARASGFTATLHWLFGLACIESQNFAEGAEQMRQCLAKRNKAALSPVNRNILKGGPNHCLAMCLIALKQFAAAEQTLRAALADEPGSVGVRFELARLWVSQGKSVDALTLLHQMISENAGDARIWLFGGQVALSQPELLEFASDWTGEAVRHFPQDREIALQRAEALLLSGKIEQAHPLFRLHLDQGNWRTLAAISLIELIMDGAEPGLPVKDQTAVGREFVQWYRRLLAFDAGPIIEQVNVRLPQLRAILPSAAAALEAALADAVA